MEFILLIGYTIGIYLLGIRNGIRTILENEIEYPDDVEDESAELQQQIIEETNKESKIMIRIEYDEKEKYFFVHEEDTHKFMAHGKTWREVETRLKERFPGMKFGIDEDHAREIGIM